MIINNFFISDSLEKLKERSYDNKINETINLLLENFDESQLKMIASNYGLKIDNNLIRLFFVENIGFRCMNEKDNLIGKMPICINIENFMNKLYLNWIESNHM